MNFIKKYKLFNESEVSKFTIEDIVRCYEEDKPIYAEIIEDFPNNDKEKPLKVVSVDDGGLITVLVDGNLKNVKLKNVDKLGNEKNRDI